MPTAHNKVVYVSQPDGGANINSSENNYRKRKPLSLRFFRHYIHSENNIKTTRLTVLFGIGYNNLS